MSMCEHTSLWTLYLNVKTLRSLTNSPLILQKRTTTQIPMFFSVLGILGDFPFLKVIQLKGQHSNYSMSQEEQMYFSENSHLLHFSQLTWSDNVVPYKNARDLAIDTKSFLSVLAIARLFWGIPLQTFPFLDLINLLIPKYCFMQNTLLTDKFTKKRLPEKSSILQKQIL